MPPARLLLVTASPFETRAALLEGGVVVELFHERRTGRGIAGNIYKGRVRKVLPGMQSAFVDIDQEKDAFLYVSDVADGRWLLGDAADEPEAAADPAAAPSIGELVREGEELLVQVVKEPIAGKGARVTTHVTLPGRCLVLMPTVRHLGVSRRIVSEAERARLKALVAELGERLATGFIVRTAAEGQPAEELEADAAALAARWRSIEARAVAARAPAPIHEELGLVDKLLRDVVTGDIDVRVDDPRDHERVLAFVAAGGAAATVRVALHAGPESLFDAYGVEDEIERALRSKVWLKSGGYIVINQTEALVAIDVNTGRYVGKVTLEDTVLRTNLEAIREIVRQIRLRDLGGIIVVDFIDMEEPVNRERVARELEDELRRDRSKSKILQISDFGLIEMTRKRVRGSLERTLSTPCGTCGGSGRVKSPQTVCYEIHRELLKAARGWHGQEVELRVHPDVAGALAGSERAVVEDLERELGVRLRVVEDAGLHADRYDVMVP